MPKRIVMGICFVIILISTFFLFSLFISHFKLQSIKTLRYSKTENLTEVPLKESTGDTTWFDYQSRWNVFTLSFPKNWLIKECQKAEDCEYLSAVNIYPKKESNVIPSAYLHISFYTPGLSQCIHNDIEDSNRLDTQKAMSVAQNTSASGKISYLVTHKQNCYEFLGAYSNDAEKEIIVKILSSFGFTQ